MKRPIENCYWVVPGKLLAGEYPRNPDDESSREKIEALKEAGVDVFIDLTEEVEKFTTLRPYAQWVAPAEHKRFPIPDADIPPTHEQTVATLDAIDEHMEKGETVYVHCWGGIGRTGVIVGCWLARHHGSGHNALARLRKLWRNNPKSAYQRTPQTDQQKRYILNWRDPQAGPPRETP